MKEYRVYYRTWTSSEKYKNNSRKVKASCKEDADKKVMLLLKDRVAYGHIKYAELTNTEKLF